MSKSRQTKLSFGGEGLEAKLTTSIYKVGDEVTIKPEYAYLKGQEDEIWIISDVLFEFGEVMYFADKKGHGERISTALSDDQIQVVQESFKFNIGDKVKCREGFEDVTFTVKSRGRASGSGAKSYFLVFGNLVTNTAESNIKRLIKDE